MGDEQTEEPKMSATRAFLAIPLFVCLAMNTPSLGAEPPKLQPIKISKECSKYTGETPSFCTIVESSFKEIPVGTNVLYYGPVLNSPLFSSSSVVLAVGPGNSAVGHCIVYDTANPPTGRSEERRVG